MILGTLEDLKLPGEVNTSPVITSDLSTTINQEESKEVEKDLPPKETKSNTVNNIDKDSTKFETNNSDYNSVETAQRLINSAEDLDIEESSTSVSKDPPNRIPPASADEDSAPSSVDISRGIQEEMNSSPSSTSTSIDTPTRITKGSYNSGNSLAIANRDLTTLKNGDGKTSPINLLQRSSLRIPGSKEQALIRQDDTIPKQVGREIKWADIDFGEKIEHVTDYYSRLVQKD